MKKNILSKLVAGFVCVSMLASCTTTKKTEETTTVASSESKQEESSSSAAETTKADTKDDGKINVVTTIFPSYDWVKEVVGNKADNFNLTLLTEKGVDLHSYQPTTEDIAKISKCDLFVYVGGESDTWVEDVLKNATNKNMKVVNLLETVGDAAKEEEVKEGMQDDDDHDHDHGDADHDHDKEDKDHDHDHDKEDKDHDHDHDKEDKDHDHDKDEKAEEHHHHTEVEYDEHVWLSLKNAKVLVEKISSDIQAIDANNAQTYQENTKVYLEELDNLDKAYQQAVDSADKKVVLFGDRFPFRYLVDDYGLDYYAAFVGCSAETEASFDTIKFLANKVDELKLTHIFTIEKSDKNIANTIKDATKDKNQEIITLDSLQSVTRADIDAGESYLGAMSTNLTTLQEGLK